MNIFKMLREDRSCGRREEYTKWKLKYVICQKQKSRSIKICLFSINYFSRFTQRTNHSEVGLYLISLCELNFRYTVLLKFNAKVMNTCMHILIPLNLHPFCIFFLFCNFFQWIHWFEFFIMVRWFDIDPNNFTPDLLLFDVLIYFIFFIYRARNII